MAAGEQNRGARPWGEEGAAFRFRRDLAVPGLLGEPVRCDVFAGPPPRGEPRAALVFVHGGGFVGGDKDQFFGAASWLALTLGAVCVTVQYRVAPRAACPAQIVDCLGVFQWLWNSRHSLGICPELVFAVGGSPGAAIAAAAMSAGREQLPGLPLEPAELFRPVNGIFLNGIYDLTEFYRKNPGERRRVLQYLGCPAFDEALLRRYSPLAVGRAGLRVLMLHGELDQVVPLSQCRRMKEHLEGCGGRAWVQVFPGKGHAWFNRPEEQYEVLQRIAEFLQLRKNEVLGYGTEAAG